MVRMEQNKIKFREWAILLLLAGIFVIHALNINFIQDDSFISYRYAKNFINGHGLVFNPGREGGRIYQLPLDHASLHFRPSRT